MSLWPPFRSFAWWYAKHDVFHRSASATTNVTICTLLVICALAVASFEFVVGFRTIQLTKLAKAPFALSLWVGQNTIRGRELTSERLQNLEESVKKALPVANAVQIQPFYEVELTFVCSDPGRPALGLRGRTVASGDPILKRLCPNRDVDAPGIVATSRLFDFLNPESTPGYQPATGNQTGENQGTAIPAMPTARKYPDKVALAKPEWVSATKNPEMSVLGVFDGELPNFHYFLIAEAEYSKLIQSLAEPRAGVARTGEVPEQWPNRNNLPEKVLNYLANTKLDRPRQIDLANGLAWELRCLNDGTKPNGDWPTIIQDLKERMEGAKHICDAKFVADWTSDVVLPNDPLANRAYDFAEIRVNEPFQLKHAGHGARLAGYPAADDVIQQVDEIANSSNRMLLVLATILTIVGLNGCWSIHAIQSLRSQQKRPEIGMLKAMGMSSNQLRNIFIAEAISIWFRGALLGTIAGGLGGIGLLIAFISSTLSEWLLICDALPHIIGGTLGLSLIAAVISMLTGTYEARQSSPIQTLRSA